MVAEKINIEFWYAILDQGTSSSNRNTVVALASAESSVGLASLGLARLTDIVSIPVEASQLK